MDIQALKSTFHGELLEPASAGYDDARQIWNASIDKRPRLIARCSGVADVVAAVNFGRANNLVTAITRRRPQRRRIARSMTMVLS